jgi:hypothetical protein
MSWFGRFDPIHDREFNRPIFDQHGSLRMVDKFSGLCYLRLVREMIFASFNFEIAHIQMLETIGDEACS